MYILIVWGGEMKSESGHVMAHEGETFLVVEEQDGWVEATSQRFNFRDEIPKYVKIFKTAEKAEKFGKRWEGHPWWCVPKKFEIREVKPVYEKVLSGFELL